MIYAQYTDNDGDTYSVKIRKYLVDLKESAAQGGNDTLSLLKFGAYDADDPLLPPGMKMRGVRVVDVSGGASRVVPCGMVTSRLWTHAQDDLELDYSGITGTETFHWNGLVGEKPKRSAHTIMNVSDAA